MQETYTIILFYRFANIKRPEKFKDQQRKIAEGFGLKGRILIATEGVNGTLEGTTKNIKAYIRKQHQTRFFKNVVFKDSAGNGRGFTKLRVKVRPEIVTLGVGSFNIKKETAKLITPAELEKMYAKNEDFSVLDLRNAYEIKAGYFEKTIDPGLKNFRDLPQKIKALKHLKHKKLVAVCTGGIRCEKATCLLKQEGFSNVYQLQDGIHTYVKKFPGKHFKGSLFVFDNRIITSVVKTKNREVVGECFYCKAVCEEFYNDDSLRPSKKVICCSSCIVQNIKLRKCLPV